MPGIPLIDIAPLVAAEPGRHAVAAEIGRACREDGFFYVVGHGVDENLQRRLEEHSRAFFAQPVERKLEIRMSLGGRAWRGYFPPGDELTSGRPDLKEGVYFGAELPPDHPSVRAGAPLHGPNLFPTHPAALRPTVLEYLAAMTTLGHTLMRGIALSLNLEEDYFADHYTADPLILFRIFNYPRAATPPPDSWGVGEHTDYGLLTILKQDDTGGLQIRSTSGWLDATPIPNSFVCNIGDMLDRLTAGHYRSTPHRVLPPSTKDRLSYPFFFDPNPAADITPVAQRALAPTPRWDHTDPHDFPGTYGDYLLTKIGKVFPHLSRDVL
ncbi:isopenicillin N synthase family dioxygenase [Actinophytocola sp.]|uniref:isopenicillin N synthase family dioxygenase n=1 Tax=Actinophytocola sp. TaxID=1872138 RepID=UPI002D7F144E|nr:2-oxoglutarate and iron-dependent oxygenase domain-containing protein [Actinophytocola sp.]HET9138835.1 2-oxoglutarate and iron-dependent oxygenase domain-containing protein [Actinophytocola sp.]